MHRNLDANFLNVSEEIVTSQAVLDHLGVSEWPLPILNGLTLGAPWATLVAYGILHHISAGDSSRHTTTPHLF